MEPEDQLDILEGMLAALKALQAIAPTLAEGPSKVVLEQATIMGKSCESMLQRIKANLTKK